MNRLFIGICPTGISYADRTREEDGDYKKLAFLPYRSLALQVHPDCPSDLHAEITTHAATLQAQRGKQMTVSTCGQTITLGY